MSVKFLVGLFLLASSLCWTPGPNNALLARSGARFGFVHTIPHILGINVGFSVMQFMVWVGLGGLFLAFPVIREVLRYLGALILLWIAYKIATAPMGDEDTGRATKPWSFIQAAAFQWINPKGVISAISLAGSLPASKPYWVMPAIAALVFGFAGFFSATGWTMFGKGLQHYLHTPLRHRVFNVAMAALLVLTVIGLLFADLSGH